MKKLLALALLVLLVGSLFVGCNETQDPGPPYRGIYDTQTGAFINVGDKKKTINKLLGAGKETTDNEGIFYANDTLLIYYNDEGSISDILVSAAAGERFEFFDKDLLAKDISSGFSFGSSEEWESYHIGEKLVLEYPFPMPQVQLPPESLDDPAQEDS